MNWEQKYFALRRLAAANGTVPTLAAAKPGHWQVDILGIEIGGDGLLCGVGPFLTPATPEQAVDRYFEAITTELPDHMLLVLLGPCGRKHFRWTGFMWQELPVPVHQQRKPVAEPSGQAIDGKQ